MHPVDIGEWKEGCRYQAPSAEATGKSPFWLKTHTHALEHARTQKDMHVHRWQTFTCISVPATLQSSLIKYLACPPLLEIQFPTLPYFESGITPLLNGRTRVETEGLPGTCVLAFGEKTRGEYEQERVQAHVCSLSGRLHAGVRKALCWAQPGRDCLYTVQAMR